MLLSYKGVLQGSILSPSLFNIYVLELYKHITFPCKLIQFVDDIAIFVRSDNLETVLSQIEKSVNQAYQFLFSRGLSISLSKSSLIIFTRRLIHDYILLTLIMLLFTPLPPINFLACF